MALSAVVIEELVALFGLDLLEPTSRSLRRLLRLRERSSHQSAHAGDHDQAYTGHGGSKADSLVTCTVIKRGRCQCQNRTKSFDYRPCTLSLQLRPQALCRKCRSSGLLRHSVRIVQLTCRTSRCSFAVIFSTRSSRGTPRRKKHFLLDQKEDLRVKEPADGTFHCTFDGVGSP